MFEKLYIEISNICNLKCTFCPEVVRENKIMSLSDFKKFALEAKPLTKQICLHLMGEPLAHPQFDQIMNICDELNLRIFLTTNGTLIRKHQEKLLHWKSLDQINFSIHSFFANSSKGSLADYLNPILNFCEQAVKINCSYYINLRLWNLVDVDQQLNQNRPVFEAITNKFDIKLNESINVKLNKSKKIIHKLYVHFDTEFEWPNLSNSIRSQNGSCYGLRKQLAIHANGDVVPCCLDKESIINLGNMSKNSLKEILKTERSIKIIKGFENNQLTEGLCQRCQYADRFKGNVRDDK